MSIPFVTVGVIARNEEEHIGETIFHLLNLNYPKNKYKILVIDGKSTDDTQAIVKTFMKKHPGRISLIIEPPGKGGHGFARNLAIDNAKGEYIAFTDADCIVDKNWLLNLVRSIEHERQFDKSVAAAGGLRRPVPTKRWKEKLINGVLNTFLSSGGSMGFTPTKKKYAHSIPNYNAIYLLKIAKKEKYLNITWGEDYEFNRRLWKKGHKILFIKGAKVYHHQANSFGAFAYQMFQYGLGQVRTLKHLKTIRTVAILDGLFVLGLIIGLPLSFLHPIFLAVYLGCIGLCLASILLSSTLLVFQKQDPLFLLGPFVYLTQYISYGIGVLWGVWKFFIMGKGK